MTATMSPSRLWMRAAGDGASRFIFVAPPDENSLRALAASAAGAAAAEALRFDLVAAADWVRDSLAGLAPVTAGRFIVHGAHDRAGIPANRIGIEIEAALAFGTGHHGTTRGCLLALDRLCKAMNNRRRVVRILDLGTGSGVLAIAAARALQRRCWRPTSTSARCASRAPMRGSTASAAWSRS